MKKIYAKPMVSFESFAFSSNIAAGCTLVGLHGEDCASTGNQSSPESGCRFMSNGVMIFSQDVCPKTPQDYNETNLCYHTPTEANQIFMS